MAQVASTSQGPTRIISGKGKVNPKEYFKVITLRTGKELPSGEGKKVIEECKKDEDIFMEESLEEEGKKEAPREPITNAVEIVEELFVPPPYEPKLQFPGRFKKQLLAKQREKFLNIMDKVTITIPLVDAISDNPVYSKFFKDMITKRKKMEEGMAMVRYESSSVIQQALPMKLKDLGEFHLTLRYWRHHIH